MRVWGAILQLYEKLIIFTLTEEVEDIHVSYSASRLRIVSIFML